MALQYSRNRKLYRCIWLFSFLVTLIACALLFYAFYNTSRENGCAEGEECNWLPSMKTAKLRQEDCRPACTTKDCLLAANFILENMDETVDPCEDFYAYSCNGWAKSYDKIDGGILTDLVEQVQIQIKDVLESIKSPPETVAGKLRTFYDSCMDKNASEFASKSSVLKFLNKMGIPNWPHLSSNFTFTEIEKTLAMMAAYQQFPFVEFIFGFPSGNYSVVDHFYKPLVVPYESINISVSYSRPFIWERDMEEVQVLVTEILTYFGLDEDSVNETRCDFMEFDQRIRNMTDISNELFRNCFVNETLCDEARYFLDCSKEVPNEIVSLCKMIEHFITFQRIGDRYTTTSITVGNAFFTNRIFPYIANHTQRLVANYLAIWVVLNNLHYMGHRFAHLYENHLSILEISVSPFKAERWRYCVNTVSTDITNLLTLEYIAKKLPEVARKEILDLFEIIKEGLANVTATADWIGEDMREQLTEAIKSVSPNLENFIDIAVNKTEIEAAYKEYHPTKESFLLNVLEHTKVQNRRNLLHFSSSLMREYFISIRPFSANAMYNINNQLDFLFGIFLPPIYKYGRSKLENLPVLGTLIGHEVGHAVSNFFKKLKLEVLDEQTRKSYLERKSCLTNQYGDFEIRNIGKKVKSAITFPEDLADHLGVAVALRAYRRHLERNQDEVRAIPGLDLTPEQIFFLSYAQKWCAVKSKEKAMKHWHIDVHSPPEFRVTGVVQNMQEFAEAFKCPRGSPMNPEDKCSFLLQPSNRTFH